MNLVVIISVWLLLLLINADLLSATHFLCLPSLSCTISNAKTADDFFVLQYTAKNIRFVFFQHIQMEHLDTSLLNRIGDAGRVIVIKQSEALSRLSVSADSTIEALYVKFTSLKSIHFETNQHLYLFSVQTSNMVSIPSTVHRGIALITFEIVNSAIRTLDLALFCDVPLLKHLNLKGNKIRSVVNSCPRVCKVYDSLESVILSYNLLKIISITLFRPFVKLQTLQFNENLIRSFTGCLASDMLQELDVSNNRLKSFSLCQWRIPFLTVLSLNSNQLTVIPPCLDNLRSLKKLDIDNNRISAIEFSEMGWMDNLEHISLNHNRIRSITLNSSDFPMKLEKLNVDHNNITELNLLFVPVEALVVNAAYNNISSFNINATSNHIIRLTMEGNPVDCTWKYPEERMYSKCYNKNA